MIKHALILVLGLAHAFEVIPENNLIALHLKASYGVTSDNIIVDLADDEQLQVSV
jgi:hypothetical protein